MHLPHVTCKVAAPVAKSAPDMSGASPEGNDGGAGAAHTPHERAVSEREVGGGHPWENRAGGMASRGGATRAVTTKQDLGASRSETARTAEQAPGADPVYGHRGIRLTSDEIDDLCYRHCELGEPLTAEEIDRLLDTAAAAHALAADLDNRLRGAAS